MSTACVIYDFIGEIIFCWHHHRYECLEFVTVSKEIIQQIYISNENKNFGVRVSLEYLVDDF